MRQQNQPIDNFAMYEVTVNFYMFGSFMKGRILGKLDGKLIITKGANRERNGELKIINNIFQPL